MQKILLLVAIVVAIVITALVAGSRNNADIMLERAASLADSDPSVAALVLDSVEEKGLSAGNRARFGLLRIKANDKRYIRHISDSLIRQVLDYYGSHGSEAERTEALYYGGRVYADLGDAPRALMLFDKALKRAEKIMNRSQLHLNILFQKGKLLRDMALYDQGIECHKQTIELDKELNDTFWLFMDYDHLAGAYMNMGELDKAEDAVRNALRVRCLSDQEQARMQANLADIKYERGSIEEALQIIRGIPERVDSVSRNNTLVRASNIYWRAGLVDSALMYARELLIDGGSNKDKALKVILYASLQAGVSTDSLRHCVDNYLEALVERFQSRNEEAAVIRNGFYNYSRYQADYLEAKRSRDSLVALCVALGACVSLAIIALLYLAMRQAKIKARMQEQVLSLNAPTSNSHRVDVEELKKQINDRFSQEADSLEGRTPSYFAKRSGSEGRRIIEEAVAEDRAIHDDSYLWTKMEEWVVGVSDYFSESLKALAGNELPIDDYRMALMIRCGATPTDISVLIGRDKSTVTKRRKRLCRLLFRENGDLRTMDVLIRQL